MTSEEISNEIITYVKSIAQNNQPLDLTPQTEILNEQVIDSLGIIQLITFLESKFNVKLEQSELNFENLGSIECMVKFLELKKV